MGFWNDLKDANPHKSVARGQELSNAEITSILVLPDFMIEKAKECSICKVRFGQIFAKNSVPCLINLKHRNALSFTDSDQLIVCDKCVDMFGLARNCDTVL